MAENKAEKKEKKEKKDGLFKRIGRWFRGMKSELKKVVWPTWSQLLNNTVVVIVVSLIVALIVGVFDFAAMKGIEALLGLI